MFEKTGVATPEMVRSKFPDKSVLVRPKAIIECYREIPCNPCETSCPFDAIHIGDDINKIPSIDFNRCTGCGICAAVCPGLAIMIAMIKNGKAYFKIPYELLPLPKVGERWTGVNRRGETLEKPCLIENVQVKKDRTTIVTISIEQPYLYEFITIGERL
ncbi:MAG: 4Fe-4S binding protein [Candidatus Izemoplasmatales bacterium]|nr:4Fe-4S binding protein [Candidatus Izemoplasmatales bacterium]MDY0138928.1 4Fe-4S binding protein [Candidatus Izemoplasmatales bacterium]